MDSKSVDKFSNMFKSEANSNAPLIYQEKGTKSIWEPKVEVKKALSTKSDGDKRPYRKK